MREGREEGLPVVLAVCSVRRVVLWAMQALRKGEVSHDVCPVEVQVEGTY